jgi:hypothetical protein
MTGEVFLMRSGVNGQSNLVLLIRERSAGRVNLARRAVQSKFFGSSRRSEMAALLRLSAAVGLRRELGFAAVAGHALFVRGIQSRMSRYQDESG